MIFSGTRAGAVRKRLARRIRRLDANYASTGMAIRQMPETWESSRVRASSSRLDDDDIHYAQVLFGKRVSIVIAWAA